MKAREATPSQPRPTEEPVDVLVNLAREGEIDPWDIDIVEVTDKFLERLDEADLARSGRGILYASILLRMKSDYLVEEDTDEEDPDDEGPMELGWGGEAAGPGSAPEGPAGPDPIDKLEREFERRLDRKRVRDRSTPETLDELVRELRERERGSWWKEHREYDTSEDAVEVGGGAVAQPTTEDAMDTAHEDDIEDHIDDVWALLAEEFEARNEVLFRELLPGDADKHDVIVTYLSCLFLANRDRLGLEQDELYGDLWLQQRD